MCADRADAAVDGQHTEFREIGPLCFDGVRENTLGLLQVVGVERVAPILVAADRLVGPHVVEGAHAGVPGEGRRFRVKLPNADPRSVERELKALGDGLEQIFPVL